MVPSTSLISYSTQSRDAFQCSSVVVVLVVVDAVSSGKPGWSSWSDFGPCGSNCRKTRQRFCASLNKDVDCPGHSFGVESQEVVCPSQECNGK